MDAAANGKRVRKQQQQTTVTPQPSSVTSACDKATGLTRSYLERRINRNSMTDSIWSSSEEVDVSIETVVTIMKRKRKLPAPLVEAYKHALDTSTRDLTRRFYEQLTSRCPEALDYFMD